MIPYILFAGLGVFCLAVFVLGLKAPKKEDQQAATTNIELCRDAGVLYTNDEIIVIAEKGFTRDEVYQIAADVGAKDLISKTEVGFYLFKFGESKSLDELREMAAAISDVEGVSKAFIHVVYMVEEYEGA